MAFIKATVILLVVILNTVFWVPILIFFSLIKFIIPVSFIRRFLSKLLIWIAESWIWINTASHKLLHGNKVIVSGLQQLDKNDWYLVISNHRAAADIPILQNIFHKKIPFLKFFLKKELIWVPLLGVAWWALDFPFMRRFSAGYLAKNPHMKGKDLEITKQACEKFKDYPISVLNFVEGTRFSTAKHQKQHSRYKHLLKPKSGGVGFVLGSMGQQMNYLLLVSLKYSPLAPTVWQYLAGDYNRVEVIVEKIKIPDNLKNKNYITDMEFRKNLQKWLNKLWLTEDERLS
ncbi:Acyltransferase family protein [hydrothermal vent metagenome]|uniref:Acyltransferase family protein n=1 Tax=hydrothermal vent metagenome TaxID=652676 RepID=A0A3B0V9P3_9ZZZZ